MLPLLIALLTSSLANNQSRKVKSLLESHCAIDFILAGNLSNEKASVPSRGKISLCTLCCNANTAAGSTKSSGLVNTFSRLPEALIGLLSCTIPNLIFSFSTASLASSTLLASDACNFNLSVCLCEPVRSILLASRVKNASSSTMSSASFFTPRLNVFLALSITKILLPVTPVSVPSTPIVPLNRVAPLT